MIVLVSAIIILLAAVFIISWRFINEFLFPETRSHEECYNRELELGSFDEKYYKGLVKEEFRTDSKYGYPLNGIWFPNGDSRDTVILVHGYRASLFTSLRYLRLFHEKGFNVLIYDQRHHGKSGGTGCTMGSHERFDLCTIVSWVIDRTGPLSRVGVHGESMGAATAVMHASIDDRIAFTIADCPYEDLFRQFAYRLKAEFRLPAFPFMYIGSLLSRIRLKFFFHEVSPIKEVPKIKTPILYIHGDADDYVPTSHSVHMYQTTRARKGLYLAEGAGHAESIFKDPKGYEKVVFRFIDSLKPVETDS